MKHVPISIEGWWISAFLAVLFGARASYSFTQQDLAWVIVFGAACVWAIWDSHKCYTKLLQQQEAEEADS